MSPALCSACGTWPLPSERLWRCRIGWHTLDSTTCAPHWCSIRHRLSAVLGAWDTGWGAWRGESHRQKGYKKMRKGDPIGREHWGEPHSCLCCRWGSAGSGWCLGLPAPAPRWCQHASSPRSVVGIPTCECLVQLQPRQNYTIYVRALNVGGPSARSEPATVHTTGLCPHHTLTRPRVTPSWQTQYCCDFIGKIDECLLIRTHGESG